MRCLIQKKMLISSCAFKIGKIKHTSVQNSQFAVNIAEYSRFEFVTVFLFPLYSDSETDAMCHDVKKNKCTHGLSEQCASLSAAVHWCPSKQSELWNESNIFSKRIQTITKNTTWCTTAEKVTTLRA